MRKGLLLTLILTSTFVAGCADTPSTFSFGTRAGQTICLEDNPEVRPEFFLAVRRALIDKGFNVVRIMHNQKGLNTCPQTLRYDAIYGSSWSHSSLRYAKLELTEVSRHNNIYTVQWDERSATPTLFDKVNDASVEIRELVDRLFPEDIPWR